MIYKNAKPILHSPDGDTEFFDIVGGVFQGDTLPPIIFIICLEYALRTSIDLMKGNGFALTKGRRGRYPVETITDKDYADALGLLKNTFAQTEAQLHSLVQATEGIDLSVIADVEQN